MDRDVSSLFGAGEKKSRGVKKKEIKGSHLLKHFKLTSGTSFGMFLKISSKLYQLQQTAHSVLLTKRKYIVTQVTGTRFEIEATLTKASYITWEQSRIECIPKTP